MVDRYTKAVLTLIAVALTAIAIHGYVKPAWAQSDACGDVGNPCYVRTMMGGGSTVMVQVEQ